MSFEWVRTYRVNETQPSLIWSSCLFLWEHGSQSYIPYLPVSSSLVHEWGPYTAPWCCHLCIFRGLVFWVRAWGEGDTHTSLCFLFSLSFLPLSKSHYSLSDVCYLTFLSSHFSIWFDTCLFSEWVLRNPFANPCCLYERMDSKHVSTSKSLYPYTYIYIYSSYIYIYMNLSYHRLFYMVKAFVDGFCSWCCRRR